VEILKFPDFLQILFLGRRGRLLLIKGKAVYEDFYKEKWPRATRKLLMNPFYEGNNRYEDFYKRKRPRAARKCFIKAFYKGTCNYKDFYEGNWPRAARNFLKS